MQYWTTQPFSHFFTKNLTLYQACYEFGEGVPQNYQEARRLYQLSAAQNPLMQEALNELDDKIRTECPLLGKRVRITSTSRTDLNFQTGVATSFNHAQGRYVVVLDTEQDPEIRELDLLLNSLN